MLTALHKEQAGALSLALSWGYAELSEAVQWADEIIGQSDVVDDTLISVSLANNKADAIMHLNITAGGQSEWNILRKFLGRFEDTESMSYEPASNLAKMLYLKCTYDEDVPDDLCCFNSHWDAIDLAKDGNVGKLEVKIDDFLNDIKTAGMKF